MSTPMHVTVDLVVLTVRVGEFLALTIRRKLEPYAGRWALPGGFVLGEEDLVDAAHRELSEESGIAGLRTHLEQLRTYGEPGRDPRGRVVSVAYLALVPDPGEPVAGSDAAEAAWTPVEDLLGADTLAFDHARILRDGVERARAKLEYTSLGAHAHPRAVHHQRAAGGVRRGLGPRAGRPQLPPQGVLLRRLRRAHRRDDDPGRRPPGAAVPPRYRRGCCTRRCCGPDPRWSRRLR